MESDPLRRYHEWPAPASAGDTVLCLWAAGPSNGDRAIRPDGCLDLIWLDGSMVVAGPDTATTYGSPSDGAVGLRFRPGRAGAGLGVPPAELLDGRFPLADLWGDGSARRLADTVGDAPSLDAAGQLLVDAVQRHHSTTLSVDRQATAAVDLLAASRGQLGVEATARRVELGPRQLRDRVTAAVGYGPKLFGRVMRFRAALDQIEQTDIGLATVAIDAGYADQAHLTREVRALAGSTPGRLRADSLAADSFKTALVASGP